MKLFRKPAPELDVVELVETSPHQMPEQELAWLKTAYTEASVILEYGCGRSTLLASAMPGTTLYSVESDKGWAQKMQARFAQNPPAATVHLHHVDVGETGKWGNPIDESGWQRYHSYPVSVWDRSDFIAPDLVFIDGRFRMACWITALLRIKQPTVVLFDDYTDRPNYHLVEEFAKPVATCGRMARFELTPRSLDPADLGKILNMYTVVD